MNDFSPVTLAQAPVAPASAILVAAGLLLPSLERGQRVDSAMLRAAMEIAFGASDATGAWDWKTAYDACEAATVLFLRKYGTALFRKAGSPSAILPQLGKIAGLMPTHTRRSEEAQTFQRAQSQQYDGVVVQPPKRTRNAQNEQANTHAAPQTQAVSHGARHHAQSHASHLNQRKQESSLQQTQA